MKYQVLVFGAIALAMVVGVDFYGESKKSGKSLGEYGLSGYAESITGRWGEVQASKALEERQAQPARSHLPETVAGWTRRAWDDADVDRFFPGQFDQQNDAVEMMGGKENVGPLAGMVLADQKAFLKRMRDTGWVYQRGDEAVLIRATFSRERRDDSFSGQMMQMALGNMAAMTDVKGFAFVQGVGYVQSALLLIDDDGPVGPDAPLSLTGRIGQGEEVAISVDARAWPESIRELLAQIDYDAMNAMLTYPDPNVGSHVPEFDLDQQIQLAEMGAEERLAALAERGVAAKQSALAMHEEQGSLGVAATEVGARMGLSGGEVEPEPPAPAPPMWDCVKVNGAKRCKVKAD